MFAYCGNNPVFRIDVSGFLWKEIEDFLEDLYEDYCNYDSDNEDIEKTYEASYFSSYKGTLVIRHSSDFLTSGSFGQIIFLNHNLDNHSKKTKEQMLRHEYGHIVQEQQLEGKYWFAVALPSITVNLISRFNKAVSEDYYDFPWEYDADVRGGVERAHGEWSDDLAEIYFGMWKALECP